MITRWIGCLLIVSATSFCGFSHAIGYRREEKMLRELHRVIQNMECELSYQLSPLPELTEHGASFASGDLKELLLELSANLKQQQFPDAEACLCAAMEQNLAMPPCILELLHLLSRSLGRFDLPGQLRGFAEVQQQLAQEQHRLADNRDNRLRSYCILGICTGIALAILLI